MGWSQFVHLDERAQAARGGGENAPDQQAGEVWFNPAQVSPASTERQTP